MTSPHVANSHHSGPVAPLPSPRHYRNHQYSEGDLLPSGVRPSNNGSQPKLAMTDTPAVASPRDTHNTAGPFTRSYTVPAPHPIRQSVTIKGLSPSRSSSPSATGSGTGSRSGSSSGHRRHSLPGSSLGVDELSSSSSSTRPRHSGNDGNGMTCARWARVVAAAHSISANVDASKFSISNTLADAQSSATQAHLARHTGSSARTSLDVSPVSSNAQTSDASSLCSSSSTATSSTVVATRLAATSRFLSHLIHDIRLEVDDDIVQLDRAIVDLIHHARKLVLSGIVPGAVPMATFLETLHVCERGIDSVALALQHLCTVLYTLVVDAMSQAAGTDANVPTVFAPMHIDRPHFVSQLDIVDTTRLAPPSSHTPLELANLALLQAQVRDAALTLNRLDHAVKRAPGLICQTMFPFASSASSPGPPSPSPGPLTKGLHRSASFSALATLSSHAPHRPPSILSTFSSLFSPSSTSHSRSPSPGRSTSPSAGRSRLSISSSITSTSLSSSSSADNGLVMSPTEVATPPAALLPPLPSKRNTRSHVKSAHSARSRSLSPIRETRGPTTAFGKWKRSMASAMHHVLHPRAHHHKATERGLGTH